MMDGDHYLIVGAGIFGSSTVLELRKRRPDARVTLLDRGSFPNPYSASADLNKIIRADYQDVFYMQLALEAQELWRKDPIYKPYYYETGMLYAESKGMAQDFPENYRSLNVTPASEIFTAEESKSRWGGDFRNALWDGISQTYFNPRSGSGDGDGALRSIIQASIDEGATWQQARVDVSTLIIDENMSC
jgi:sarcosine oxidase / L-pipecolate oxidase